LLVGNSRWHWADAGPGGLRIRHLEAAEVIRAPLVPPPAAWAAVGSLPSAWPAESAGRVVSADVPLRDMPAWLGVDRALAGWLAWRQRAGAVLSLTRVDRHGRFAGGRLIAGMGLQLRAMAQGTAALPEPPASGELPDLLARGDWPAVTDAAMAVGVAQALAAALAMALRQAWADLPGCSLVLTGGDASSLLPLVRQLLAAEAASVLWEPDLALRGLVALRPLSPPGDQVSPRSAST
jgi:type III pantothenate kinase